MFIFLQPTSFPVIVSIVMACFIDMLPASFASNNDIVNIVSRNKILIDNFSFFLIHFFLRRAFKKNCFLKIVYAIFFNGALNS